jgi:hypothetical protein
VRDFDSIFLIRQDKEVIRNDRSIDGRWILFHGFPIWEQLSKSSGFKAVAAQNVITNLGSFLDEAYINRAIVLFLFLF